MDVFFLVDYDNIPEEHKRYGLAAFIVRLQALGSKHMPKAGDFFTRLYGGWYSASGLTNPATLLTQEIQRDCPLIVTNGNSILRRVHCELASSLLEVPSYNLGWTLRKREGIRSRLTRRYTPACHSLADCSIDKAVAWSRGQCPVAGCGVTASDAFNYYEQKLVDTLLCCDLLSLALRSPAPDTFVVSDDDDMLPAMIMAAKVGGRVWKCGLRTHGSSFYAGALNQYAVKTVTL